MTLALGARAATMDPHSLFDAEKTCSFSVPMRDGTTVKADERPLVGFGRVTIKTASRTTNLKQTDVLPISDELKHQWDECGSWKELDSRGLAGRELPGWTSLVPATWKGATEHVFVYVFWGWCEPCMVALKAIVPELGEDGRVLIVAMDASNPMWERAFSKHGLASSTRLHVTYLEERPFQELSLQLERGALLGLSLITTGDGCILHSHIGTPILDRVWRRVRLAGEPCRTRGMATNKEGGRGDP